MEKLDSAIRSTVRAVILREGHILFQKKQDEQNGVYYTLPGGAQESGESMIEALQRECREEIGSDVIIGDVLHLADYFKQKVSPHVHIRHQLEILFSCQVTESYQPQNGYKPDKHQVAVEWVAINKFSKITLSPGFLSQVLPLLSALPKQIYLGKFN